MIVLLLLPASDDETFILSTASAVAGPDMDGSEGEGGSGKDDTWRGWLWQRELGDYVIILG